MTVGFTAQACRAADVLCPEVTTKRPKHPVVAAVGAEVDPRTAGAPHEIRQFLRERKGGAVGIPAKAFAQSPADDLPTHIEGVIPGDVELAVARVDVIDPHGDEAGQLVGHIRGGSDPDVFSLRDGIGAVDATARAAPLRLDSGLSSLPEVSPVVQEASAHRGQVGQRAGGA
jgi:hypothetical protein